ncbi:MAG: Rne/Rng family ribonuclease [Desulfobacterales bacterium]|nr:Rne/Rng family ribonuclease [Desulfobacterales bacterium]MDD4072284.1 Rne/Rng family ribonuclease [Desulfobacterales bacterium]MDD4392695.1 Rne/Rng family ribonuclease [Desulfobacterales bacterium]
MNIKILINAIDPEECRIATVKDNKLEEFNIETTTREITQGNIYKGIVTRIEPALQAAFVDYGAERHGFLQKNEIHSDYYQDNHTGDNSIENIVKRGQEVLVQVSKEPDMKKGAMLTTFVSLPGRHIVLMPGSSSRGVSRKIEDEEERARLKDLMESLKMPDGFGLIIRTAGSDCSKTLIYKDLRYLLKLWKNIMTKGLNEKAPTLLYKDRILALRSIRDSFSDDVTGILVDNDAMFNEVKEFINIISPKHTKIVKLHKGPKPIFTKYQLEDQIASIFETRVILKSGGSIVIERTEAMVTIDVNSGKAIHKKSVEATAFLTNIEAAEEIARQLRMRDLGGLIVIDFIDMRETKHKMEVEKTLKNHIKPDKARTKVGRISKFGLIEMSRQRIRPSIEFGSYEPCPYCRGKGLTPSTETMGLSFLRKLRIETLKSDIHTVKGIVPVRVADYLLNKKRKEILDLELRRDLSIKIEGDTSLIPGKCKIMSE